MKLSQSKPVTYIGVDLAALRSNLRRIASKVPRSTRLLVVVKAEAYGHGMIRVAREIQKTGIAEYLGVSSAGEALRLRKAGIRMPILVLGVIHPGEYRDIVRSRITSTVSSLEEAAGLDRTARSLGVKAKVHAELDTGMGRLGVWCGEAIWFLHQVHEMRQLELEGIFTHFPSADEEDPRFSRSQIEIFGKAVQIAEELFGKPFRYVHMANSAGILSHADSHFNLVRPGISVYGVKPNSRPIAVNLKPVLSFRSRISLIKTVEKGRSVSYARAYIASRPTRIATVPVGYSSGYSFHLSNRAHVLIRGKRYPIAGRITMDQIMVDIGLEDPIRRWDEVTLIGRSGAEEISVEELAGFAGTIPYQILCGLSASIPRVYRA